MRYFIPVLKFLLSEITNCSKASLLTLFVNILRCSLNFVIYVQTLAFLFQNQGEEKIRTSEKMS